MLYKHKEFILAEDEKQLHSLAKWLQYQFLSFQWLPKNDKSEEIHGANQTSALKSLSHPHKKSVLTECLAKISDVIHKHPQRHQFDSVFFGFTVH